MCPFLRLLLLSPSLTLLSPCYSPTSHTTCGESRSWTLQFSLNGKTYSTATEELSISNCSGVTGGQVSGITHTHTHARTHTHTARTHTHTHTHTVTMAIEQLMPSNTSCNWQLSHKYNRCNSVLCVYFITLCKVCECISLQCSFCQSSCCSRLPALLV